MDIDVDWLNLKTLDGNVILEKRISDGDEFLVGLEVPKTYLESVIAQNVVGSAALWIEKLKKPILFQRWAWQSTLFYNLTVATGSKLFEFQEERGLHIWVTVFFVIAPSGCRKTKLIVDLAFIKDKYVMYMDFRKQKKLFDSLKKKSMSTNFQME